MLSWAEFSYPFRMNVSDDSERDLIKPFYQNRALFLCDTMTK